MDEFYGVRDSRFDFRVDDGVGGEQAGAVLPRGSQKLKLIDVAGVLVRVVASPLEGRGIESPAFPPVGVLSGRVEDKFAASRLSFSSPVASQEAALPMRRTVASRRTRRHRSVITASTEESEVLSIEFPPIRTRGQEVPVERTSLPGPLESKEVSSVGNSSLNFFFGKSNDVRHYCTVVYAWQR